MILRVDQLLIGGIFGTLSQRFLLESTPILMKGVKSYEIIGRSSSLVI